MIRDPPPSHTSGLVFWECCIPADLARHHLISLLQDAPQPDRAGLTAQTEVISALLRAHASGREAYTCNTAHGLLLRFLETEEAFQCSGDATEQEVIDGLRKVSMAWVVSAEATLIVRRPSSCHSPSRQVNTKIGAQLRVSNLGCYAIPSEYCPCMTASVWLGLIVVQAHTTRTA